MWMFLNNLLHINTFLCFCWKVWNFYISLGGMGFNVFDICLIAEEISYGCSGVMTAMEASGLGVSFPIF